MQDDRAAHDLGPLDAWYAPVHRFLAHRCPAGRRQHRFSEERPVPHRPADRPTDSSLIIQPWAGRLVSRRRVISGVTGLGVAAVMTGCGDSGSGSAPTAVPPTQAPELGVVGAPSATTAAPVTPVGSAGEPAQALAAQTLPGDAVLVVSPRLPLAGIGSRQQAGLLDGTLADWEAVGSPASLPVEALGEVGADGYDDAVEQLDGGLEDLAAPVGRVAAVPLAAVDFRVNVLSVDGRDALRDRTEGEHGPIIRVGMVGDIVPGRNIHLTMERYGDYQYPFRRVAERLAGFDLTIANLEGNISDTLENPVYSHPNTIDFVTGSAFLDGFKLAGIDAVTLGNNHSCFNETGWGTQGLEDTMAALAAAELPYFGAGYDITEARAAFTTEIRGVSIAILGHDAVTANLDIGQDRKLGVVAQTWGADDSSPGTNPFGLDQFLADVESAVAEHDIVIPYLHGGAEFQWIVPEWLQMAARGAIDAGATLVVTNHPHIIQGMEVYAGRPIVYSLGNFIFDQMFSVDTRQGFILDLTFDGPVLVGLRLGGVEIMDFCQPRPMAAAEQAAMMDRFWRSNDRLASR